MSAGLVDLTGKPIAPRTLVPAACPRCQAGVEKRTLSAGFGTPHDVCIVCGHEFSIAESRPR